MRRAVFEAGETRDILPDDAEREDVLSDLQRENLRFWTAVLANYAFSDVTVDVPDTTKESALYVKVRNSGFGDWGLSFVGYLYRSSPHIGCYLTCRKDIPQAVRVYERVGASLPELRQKRGDDLRTWESNLNAGSRIYMTRAIDRKRPVDTAIEVCPGIYRAIAEPKSHRKTYRQFSPGFFDPVAIGSLGVLALLNVLP